MFFYFRGILSARAGLLLSFCVFATTVGGCGSSAPTDSRVPGPSVKDFDGKPDLRVLAGESLDSTCKFSTTRAIDTGADLEYSFSCTPEERGSGAANVLLESGPVYAAESLCSPAGVDDGEASCRVISSRVTLTTAAGSVERAQALMTQLVQAVHKLPELTDDVGESEKSAVAAASEKILRDKKLEEQQADRARAVRESMTCEDFARSDDGGRRDAMVDLLRSLGQSTQTSDVDVALGSAESYCASVAGDPEARIGGIYGG